MATKKTKKQGVKKVAAKKTPAKATKPVKKAPKAKPVKKAPRYSSLHWDPSVEKDRNLAKMTFDSYEEKNFKAFRIDAKGNKGKRMAEFDPQAGGMVFVKAPPPTRYSRIAEEAEG